MKRVLVILFVLIAPPVHVLAQNNIGIFVDTGGNDTLQKLVTTFVTELKKSWPINFIVQPASGYTDKGIYISPASASKKVRPPAGLLKLGVEAYSISGTPQTVRIMGNSNLAVGHGLFSYLELLGYRYYFANAAWHIIPTRPTLWGKWNIVSSPSFNHRRIWYGYGTGSKQADADYNFWVMANKLGGSMNASYGHAYEDIAFRNLDAFAKHPEWCYPPLPSGTKPYNIKLDMSREDLVQFVIQDVEKRVEASLKNKTNAYKMISMAPSDGPGTCNTPACQKLGTITDRVYYLTNRVAKAIRKKYPQTLIGCMAYGEYAPPPTNKVEPNVFVAITTAFNSSKFSNEQLVEEWRKKGAIIGIYDYFSWYAWDFDVPGKSLASMPDKMLASIKKYHAKGVRAYEGESSIGWVSKGLGYYLGARQMWNVNADAKGPRNEFFKLCFGKASPAMQKLWEQWEKNAFENIRETDLAGWIDLAFEADQAESNAKIRERLYQVKCYLHYLALYRNYKLAKNEANLHVLLNYGYRKLDDGSVSGFPAFFQLGNNSGIAGMANDDKAKWKNDKRPVTNEEITNLLRADRSRLKVHGSVQSYVYASSFTTIPNIARFQKLFLDSAVKDNAFWYTNEWVIEIKKKGPNNYLDFTGDYIGNPNVVRPIKISIYRFTRDGVAEGTPALVYYEYKSTMVKERISLAQLDPGYYTMVIEDPVKIYRFNFSPAVNNSMIIRKGRPLQITALNHAFIYVPERTKKFNVIKSGLLKLITPTGRELSYMNNDPMDLQIEVRTGESGLWRLKPVYTSLYVEGIPPYVGTSAPNMLIPSGTK